jgi:hypothetical protein
VCISSTIRYGTWNCNISDKDPRSIHFESISHCNVTHVVFRLSATEENERSDVTHSPVYYLL